jgi:hypothetical protein
MKILNKNIFKIIKYIQLWNENTEQNYIVMEIMISKKNLNA